MDVSSSPTTTTTNDLLLLDSTDMLTHEEKQLQHHMSNSHSIDFAQIMQQHQQLQLQQNNNNNNAAGGGGTGSNVAAIESTPMNDMYLSIQIKALRYIDDDLLRKDEFRADMVYSCPICTGDTHVHNAAHLKPPSSAIVNDPARLVNAYANFESVTFEYLMNHFLVVHQFKVKLMFP